MESQKFINLVEDSDDYPKFQTKVWHIINDQNNCQYGKGDNSTVKYSTEIVKTF